MIGRIIDRPIRPLFPKGYRQQVQVVSSVLSMDPNFRTDMVAMVAASTALSLTGTPFDGPIAGLRVAQINGEFKAFASPEELKNSDLDLVVAGKEQAITMVEAGANEVSEETIVEAAGAQGYGLLSKLKELLKVAPELKYELILPNEEIKK